MNSIQAKLSNHHVGRSWVPLNSPFPGFASLSIHVVRE